MACAVSVLAEQGLPDTSSRYADEGTVAHFLASECWTNQEDTHAYLGREILMHQGVEGWYHAGDIYDSLWKVNADLAKPVQIYLDNTREAAAGGHVCVEHRVDLTSILGPDQSGTADLVVLRGDELQIHDYKHGRGVRVDAENNPQLQLYALGALEEFDLLGEVARVRLFIHQPRLQHLSEWDMSVEDLRAFGRKASDAASKVLDILDTGIYDEADFRPGEKQCRFCKAFATCDAARKSVAGTVGANPDDFEVIEECTPVAKADAETLGVHMSRVDFVEAWAKAVRAETERRLLAGTDVPGFKLVKGRAGARAWTDAVQAEATLKSMRLKHDQIYDYSVISPTRAERLTKATGDEKPALGARQWAKLQPLISRSDGKPSVAPVSDPREALVLRSADDFTAVEDNGASLV